MIEVKATKLDEPDCIKIMPDRVNHPSHYIEGRKYEPIKVINDWDLGFNLGNALKYISRAGRKSSAAQSDLEKEIEDLKKAQFYLNYEIKYLEEKLQNEEIEKQLGTREIN